MQPLQPKIEVGVGGVCLLHTSRIHVFFATKAEALRAHYDISVDGQGGGGTVVNKINGYIHPFSGLRGDAKALWQAVQAGQETRLRLLRINSRIPTVPDPISIPNPSLDRASTSTSVSTVAAARLPSAVEKLFDEAAVIIWACGYRSNLGDLPILDAAGQPLPLSYTRGQIDVDIQARVLLRSNIASSDVSGSGSGGSGNQNQCQSVAAGLLGTGHGFGIKVLLENGDVDTSSGRADGVVR